MNDSNYIVLREQIEGLLTETRQRTKTAADWEKVETYWHIGDAVDGHLADHPDSTYGKQVVTNLSRDLKLSRSALYEILRFRRVVDDPDPFADTGLGWSHFRALIHLQGDQLDHYARLAADNAWSTRQLKRAIETGGDIVVTDDLAPSSPLRPNFGEPATYRVVADRYHDHAPPAIDFGFHQVWVPDDSLPSFNAAQPGSCIRLVSGEQDVRVQICQDRPRLWTYTARVLRIIDGDTLDVVINLGLGHRAFPRLRLRGLDTPELYTQAGRDARTFVEAGLADCPAIVVSTYRTDSYGRYLADVKYLPGEADPDQILAQGMYLNGELLRRRLATRYLV